MIQEKSPRFGKHAVGDRCPQTHNAGEAVGFLRAVVLELARMKRIDEIITLSKRYGVSAFRKFHLEEDARDLVKRFILTGGTQEDPLSRLLPPAVFNPNNYHTDTIVRLILSIHEFNPQETILREWRRKDQDKYCDSHQILENIHLSKVAKNLGVVTDAPNGRSRALVMFWGKEEYVVNDQVNKASFIVDSVRLGEWGHFGVYNLRIPFIDVPPFFHDTFVQISKVEILETGLKDTQKSPVPSLIPSPVHS